MTQLCVELHLDGRTRVGIRFCVCFPLEQMQLDYRNDVLAVFAADGRIIGDGRARMFSRLFIIYLARYTSGHSCEQIVHGPFHEAWAG